MFRNAPAFYKGVNLVQPCVCHLHPGLPRLQSPDGRAHIFAPQDTWPWPAELDHLRLLPSHTVLEPDRRALQRSCRIVLQNIGKRLSLNIPTVFMDEQVDVMVSALLSQLRISKLDFIPTSAETVRQVTGIVKGLIVDDFQKTKHTLVAECPRRAQLLTLRLFGADGSDARFSYTEGLDSGVVMDLVSRIQGLRAELQPGRLSRKSDWKMASASAPNKKRSKPDDRRPIVDRSRWPTNSIDVPAARALDWVSGHFLPGHLHVDLQRTDAFTPLVAALNEYIAQPCTAGMVAGDISSCFTNIKHEYVRAAWAFYKSVLQDRAPCISAPKRHRRGSVRLGEVSKFIAASFVTFHLDDLEAVILHHLRSGWFLLGSLLGREIEGLPMGSALAGALTRMVLIFFDILHRAAQPVQPPNLGRSYIIRVRSYDIYILEARYVDDCITLWRGPHGMPEDAVEAVRRTLWARWLDRYPLPIEMNMSGTFVGVAISLSGMGSFTLRPSLLPEASLYEIRDHPLFMDYCSYVSLNIKRSIVLGIAARIDAHTLPLGDKPLALGVVLDRLVREGGFPLHRVRAWLSGCGVSRWPWLESATGI